MTMRLLDKVFLKLNSLKAKVDVSISDQIAEVINELKSAASSDDIFQPGFRICNLVNKPKVRFIN